MASNRERQEEEIESISSICDSEEFFRLSCESYNLGLDVTPLIEKSVQNVKYYYDILENASDQPCHRFTVKNLPPSCLRLHLPEDYPESAPPKFTLDISWLSPWQCSLVCQQLDQLWKQNEGFEILFVWRDFLKNEILHFLNSQECLDVTFLFTVYSERYDLENIELTKLADSRAKNCALYLDPMKYLTQYDESRRNVLFRRAFHTCSICFNEFSGKSCMEFYDCSHAYCKRCIAVYFATRINEGNVARMPCPDSNCSAVARSSQVRELCPDIYPKYEELLLQLTLRTMNDVVFCPRNECQFPVIVVDGETLASCRKCEYNFCSYCRKGYHGVAPCVMTSEDNEKLIASYQAASGNQKKLLIKKYGRRQIQSVVESRLTKEYIKEKTKMCPKCRTPTEKIDGCNKMVCSHCLAIFCWICGLHITDKNSYDHFTISGTNTCYGRLFEGLMPDIDNDFPYLDELGRAIE